MTRIASFVSMNGGRLVTGVHMCSTLYTDFHFIYLIPGNGKLEISVERFV